MTTSSASAPAAPRAATPSPRRLRILIVRHGETHENVAKVIQGQLDTPLNPFGHQQAATTGAHLATTRIHRAISSPLKRAADTATAIVSRQPHQHGLTLETDPRLMERGFGVLEGKVYHGPRNKRDSIDGIEKMQDLAQRLASFWNDLVTVPLDPHAQPGNPNADDDNDGDEQTVLLVSHGAAISALLGEVLVSGQYVELAQGVQPSRLWNCSITEILVPTIPDRRSASSSSDQEPAKIASAGDPARRKQWTIRPSHLNVQGAQFMREYRALRRLLAATQHRQQQGDGRDGGSDEDLQATIRTLEAEIAVTERRFKKDPKLQARLEGDVLRGPDGEAVEADIGYGRGIGCVLRWSDVEHLRGLAKDGGDAAGSGAKQDVNVDELVGKGE
ncbi:uncharacterized protein PFL1_05492 [Pseudozyma flocculosa PF-1]|uniref:Phosphoglycerate mutase n=2 Tax=Pseudozyma flocculosa TaxID=84751 RepID=A0A5C3F9V7_9BASI|nr:uncharacterized protein PFL1_05492 [Pseudozyma flocculosa PF-1]EPQ26857.1 hypothetical protein PFL1_05492 [Pseudozyma flocculosa PF-1]SPO41238.1 uncharacterized protein PSFLO_06720 [Pseudozyma flocculosa]